jgi:putative peptide maturation system protein
MTLMETELEQSASPRASLQAAVDETLPWLLELTERGCEPDQALAELRALQARHTDVQLDLVWEREGFDARLHYDALLTLPGHGTLSVSFSPERSLPWPLRGLHRWDEMCLLRVNGRGLDVAQAVACLEDLWAEAPAAERLVNACLIQAELDREPIELGPGELQAALDAFRRGHQLYTAEATRRWMERRGLDHAQLEQLVLDTLTIARLRERLTAAQVEPYFAAHRAEFAVAELDEPTRAAIQRMLFEEWLAEQRRTAHVEWNWGKARRA